MGVTNLNNTLESMHFFHASSYELFDELGQSDSSLSLVIVLCSSFVVTFIWCSLHKTFLVHAVVKVVVNDVWSVSS